MNKPTSITKPSIQDTLQISSLPYGPKRSYYDIEVWLVARRRKNNTSILFPTDKDTGHAFVGLVGTNYHSGKVEAIRTFSYWPRTDLTINHRVDYRQLRMLLADKEISPRGHAIRKSRISVKRARWIINHQHLSTSCRHYRFIGGSTYCNCLDYSTKLWRTLTSGWEDYEFNNLELTPDLLVSQMKRKTKQQKTRYVDNGEEWL